MPTRQYDDIFTTIFTDIDLGEINETKKHALLDDVGMLLTQRILLTLIDNVPKEKKDAFIQKINEHKDDPNKILLFIDHFVENADEIIDQEILTCKEEIETLAQKN
jgi:hypothetical protein